MYLLHGYACRCSGRACGRGDIKGWYHQGGCFGGCSARIDIGQGKSTLHTSGGEANDLAYESLDRMLIGLP
ncbi:hypothetical protein [Muribaculum intestinale]|uniref:hypothetical protein n=1 Tax=Muribaculum intestinale TaxID=1796646 RepID=UPI0025A95771|nr:hypothetical protein [Muribaculum intestinale]